MIKDVVFLVGALQVFQSMYEHIVSRQGVNGTTWDEAEAALFVMSAVAKSLHPQQESVVSLVLQSILQLPDETHVAVRLLKFNLSLFFADSIRSCVCPPVCPLVNPSCSC